jgi:hypothetical protein
MVCLEVKRQQENHFGKNLERYKKEHPGEWIILDSSLKETFYKDEAEYYKALEPYKNSFGPGIIAQRIPFDKKKAEYNLKIDLKFSGEDWARISDAIGHFRTAEFVLKAEPYIGQFIVYNGGYLEKGHLEGLEKIAAELDISEPSNLEIIGRKEKKPVHAHLKTGEKIISYTPNQIKNNTYKVRL